MSKLLTTLLASTFAAAILTPVAFAAKHTMEERVATACKDKKAGTVVKVDGKDVKCPAPKTAPAK